MLRRATFDLTNGEAHPLQSRDQRDLFFFAEAWPATAAALITVRDLLLQGA